MFLALNTFVYEVAGIEMGEPGGHVDDADHWVRESLAYIERVLPEVTR